MSDEGLPLIGVPACRRIHDGYPLHYVAEKYLSAIVGGAGAMPVILPAMADGVADDAGHRFGAAALRATLRGLDGVFLTGSPSNIEPHHYEADPITGSTEMRDPHRDVTTLLAARMAVEEDIPLLAVCRGHQELNVALGGSLHQEVHHLPGRMDHRSDKALPKDAAYAPRHHISIEADGRLAAITGQSEGWVNSLHMQAIDRVAPGLVVEAVAEDGTIESVSRPGSGFVLGVQWHPEWDWQRSVINGRLLVAFGAAARGRASRRAGGAVAQAAE